MPTARLCVKQSIAKGVNPTILFFTGFFSLLGDLSI